MADTQISSFTADATPAGVDLLVTAKSPFGAGSNRKVTVANLLGSGAVPVHVNDDIAVSLGNTLAAPNAQILWETADANANALIMALPEGGATDVPVFAIGDSTILNKDLGLFNGVTIPTFAVVDETATYASKLTHAGLSFGAGVAVTATEYSVGRNADATNLIQLNVPTGAGFRFSVNGVQKAYFSQDGALDLEGNLTLGSYSWTRSNGNITAGTVTSSVGLFTASSGGATSGTLRGTSADGATAIGTILNNTVALTVAGSKITSFQNATVEKAYIDYLGDYLGGNGTAAIPAFGFMSDAGNGMYLKGADNLGWSTGTTERMQLGSTGILTVTSLVRSGGFAGVSGAKVLLKGDAPDGATAVGTDMDTYNTLTVAGSKLVSIKNAGSEKAYIGYEGTIFQNKLGTADVGTTTYNSPDHVLQSSAWDTDGSEDTWQWKFRNVPASGATTSSVLNLISQKNAVAEVNSFIFSSSGGFTAGGTMTSGTGKFGLDATDYLQFTDNTQMAIYVNNIQRFEVNTAGVEVDYLASLSVGTAMSFKNYETDAADSIAFVYDTNTAFTMAGGKLAQWKTGNVEKANIDYLGGFHTAGDIYLASGKKLDWDSGDVTLTHSAGLLTASAALTVSGTFTASAGQFANVTNVNAATYDLLVTDYILDVSYTGIAAVASLTLPTAQMVEGRIIVVKDTGLNAATNNITIDTEGAEFIDGQNTYVMNIDGQSVTLFATSTGWFVI